MKTQNVVKSTVKYKKLFYGKSSKIHKVLVTNDE